VTSVPSGPNWTPPPTIPIFIGNGVRGHLGCAIVEAASRRLPTVADRVRPQVGNVRFVVGNVTIEHVVLRVLWFFAPIVIPPPAPYLSDISRYWYSGPNSGPRTKCTRPHPFLLMKRETFQGYIYMPRLSGGKGHRTLGSNCYTSIFPSPEIL
jgi:hypothetical protein